MFRKIIDTIYLIGDGFEGTSIPVPLPVLCRGRRFSREITCTARAPVRARAKQQPGENGQNYVYLGKDMLKANIGLEASFRGRIPILPCWMPVSTGMMREGMRFPSQ